MYRARTYLVCSFVSLLLDLSFLLQSANAGISDSERVLVVYNERSPDSFRVARSYLEKRRIPERNLCALSGLSDSGTSATYIPWNSLDSLVRDPIRRCLNAVGPQNILYIVFAYKTPYKMSGVRDGYGAAIDSFVADIWNEILASGPARNPYAAEASSASNIYPPFQSLSDYRKGPRAKRIYSVFRLDGVSPSHAIGLVDRAIYAEKNGLDGQGCFDQMYSAPIGPMADSGYRSGDWDIFRASQIVESAGIPVTYDQTNVEFGTAPAPLRCENVALYAGWYSFSNYNDAFSWTPGALGLHLDSASAANPRGPRNWAGEAIRRGITFTSGSVSEPYLGNLIHPDGFYRNLVREGANVGDAAMRNTYLLGWHILNLGDPLYRPFPPRAGSSGTPGKVVMVGSTSVSANVCSQIKILVKDNNNFPTRLRRSMEVRLHSTGRGSFFSDSQCLKQTQSVQLSSEKSSETIYYRSNEVEEALLSVRNVPSPLFSDPIRVSTTRATHLGLSLAATMGTGVCTAATVFTRDSLGFKENVPEDRLINLWLSGTANGKIYSDSSCQVLATSVTVKALTNSGIFYYRNFLPESLAISVTDSLRDLVEAPNVTARTTSPSKLALSGPVELIPDMCVSFTLTTQNASSQPAAPIADTTFQLSTSGAGAFYQDSRCLNPIRALSMNEKSPTARFFYMGTGTGAFSMNALDPAAKISPAALNIRLFPPTLILMNGITTEKNKCVARQITIANEYGVPTAVGKGAPLLLESSGSGKFYSNPSCTIQIKNTNISPGRSNQTIYFKNALPELVTQTVSDPTGVLSRSISRTRTY